MAGFVFWSASLDLWFKISIDCEIVSPAIVKEFEGVLIQILCIYINFCNFVFVFFIFAPITLSDRSCCNDWQLMHLSLFIDLSECIHDLLIIFMTCNFAQINWKLLFMMGWFLWWMTFESWIDQCIIFVWWFEVGRIVWLLHVVLLSHWWIRELKFLLQLHEIWSLSIINWVFFLIFKNGRRVHITFWFKVAFVNCTNSLVFKIKIAWCLDNLLLNLHHLLKFLLHFILFLLLSFSQLFYTWKQLLNLIKVLLLFHLFLFFLLLFIKLLRFQQFFKNVLYLLFNLIFICLFYICLFFYTTFFIVSDWVGIPSWISNCFCFAIITKRYFNILNWLLLIIESHYTTDDTLVQRLIIDFL